MSRLSRIVGAALLTASGAAAPMAAAQAQSGAPGPPPSPGPWPPAADAPSKPPPLATSGSQLATELESPSAESYHERGVKLLRRGRLTTAIKALEEAVRLDDSSALYATDLGYAYLKQGALHNAEIEFRRAIKLDPHRYHAYEHLEQSVTRQASRWEKRRELLSILEQGVAENKRSSTRARIELARIRAELSFGHLERASSHLEALRDQTLSPPLVAQVHELERRLEGERAARALRDWPEPDVPNTERAHLAQLEAKGPNATPEALLQLATWIRRYPAWRAPRWLRAQWLTERGHYDEVVKELAVLTRLAPSDARYHRLLGTLLAEHGGLLELERADEELRIAWMLEPEWTELAELRQRLASRRGTPASSMAMRSATAARPTDEAVALYEEAEIFLEAQPPGPDEARRLLDQALAQSPDYVDAAALLFTVTRELPQPTRQALWNDAGGLFALHRAVTRLVPDAAQAVTNPWLDRAIELGHVEARLTRALLLKAEGNAAGAEAALSDYMALTSSREEVEAAQALRRELSEVRPNGSPALLLSARLQLLTGDADAALKTLGAPCRADMPHAQLLAIGRVDEHTNDLMAALDCYRLGLSTAEFPPSPPSEVRRTIEQRAARLLARAEPTLEHPLALSLEHLALVEPAAHWALAQRAALKGAPQVASAHIAAYIEAAPAGDRFVPAAKALAQTLRHEASRHAAGKRLRAARWRQLTLGGAGLLLLTAYLFFFRGSSVSRALQRRPRLFPAVARIIAELRHDVFKHRTSALELLGDDDVTPEQLRDTLLQPVPASELVRDGYQRLVSLARAHSITLRRLEREPVFGPLVRDLKRAEKAVLVPGSRGVLLKVDARLRSRHMAAMKQLLERGPRSQLDAAELQRWIASVHAESAASGKKWTEPALQMTEPTVRFPVDRTALFHIFANLLRNAQAAVRECNEPRIQVSVARVTDFTGQALVRLQIADNASLPFSRETVENQDTGRGLGIVRETTRAWNGSLLVDNEGAPYRKTVGVQFTQ